MDTITIPVKEYKRLLRIGGGAEEVEKKKGFVDAAFGILKNSFRKESSVSSIVRLRKAWRK